MKQIRFRFSSAIPKSKIRFFFLKTIGYYASFMQTQKSQQNRNKWTLSLHTTCKHRKGAHPKIAKVDTLEISSQDSVYQPINRKHHMIIQGVQKKDTLEQNLNFPQKQDFEGTSLSCKGHLKKILQLTSSLRIIGQLTKMKRNKM